MIPEVEGTRPWGSSRKRVPKRIKGPKTTYTTIAVAEKQSKRSKKGLFSLYIRSPRSHPGDGITGARRGRSLPVRPGFSSHDCGTWRVLPEGMSQMFRLLCLGNGWADCVEIRHAHGDPLVTAYARVTGGVSLHVRTCRDTPAPRFCISETAWPIVFKFGMWVGGH